MKKSLIIISAFTLLLINCKKTEDTPEEETTVSDATAPVVTVNGNVKDTINLQSTYGDAGAKAQDNMDGDISSRIVATGSVNTNVSGDYTLLYSVSDNAGNKASSTRSVNVRNGGYVLVGNYNVACSCSTLNPGVDPVVTSSSSYTSSAVASTTINNSLMISNLNIGTGTSVAPFINISSNQTLGGVFTQNNAAGGTITGSWMGGPRSMTLQTNMYVVNYPNKSYTCTSVFTKQ